MISSVNINKNNKPCMTIRNKNFRKNNMPEVAFQANFAKMHKSSVLQSLIGKFRKIFRFDDAHKEASLIQKRIRNNRANLRRTYNALIKSQGLEEISPNLELVSSFNRNGQISRYNPETSSVQVNISFIDFMYKELVTKKPIEADKIMYDRLQSSLRSSLKVYRAYTTVARTEGMGLDIINRIVKKEKMAEARRTERLMKDLLAASQNPVKFLRDPYGEESLILQAEMAKNHLLKLNADIKANKLINEDALSSVVNKQGLIKSDSPESQHSMESLKTIIRSIKQK